MFSKALIKLILVIQNAILHVQRVRLSPLISSYGPCTTDEDSDISYYQREMEQLGEDLDRISLSFTVYQTMWEYFSKGIKIDLISTYQNITMNVNFRAQVFSKSFCKMI